MNTNILKAERKPKGEFAQVIEPLVSYICAADRPREAFLSAVAALRNEVQETNRAARMHFSGLRADSLGLV